MDSAFPFRRPKRPPQATYGSRRGPHPRAEPRPTAHPAKFLGGGVGRALEVDSGDDDDDGGLSDSTSSASDSDARPAAPTRLVAAARSTVVTGGANDENSASKQLSSSKSSSASAKWVKRDLHSAMMRLQELYSAMRMSPSRSHARPRDSDSLMEPDALSSSDEGADDALAPHSTAWHFPPIPGSRSAAPGGSTTRSRAKHEQPPKPVWTNQPTSTLLTQKAKSAPARGANQRPMLLDTKSGARRFSAIPAVRKTMAAATPTNDSSTIGGGGGSSKRLKRNSGQVLHCGTTLLPPDPTAMTDHGEVRPGLNARYYGDHTPVKAKQQQQHHQSSTHKDGPSPPVSVWRPRLGQRSRTSNVTYKYGRPSSQSDGDVDPLYSEPSEVAIGGTRKERIGGPAGRLLGDDLEVQTALGVESWPPRWASSGTMEEQPPHEFVERLDWVLNGLYTATTTDPLLLDNRRQSYLSLASMAATQRDLQWLCTGSNATTVYSLVRRQHHDRVIRAASMFIVAMLIVGSPKSAYALSVELQALEDIPGWAGWSDDPFVAARMPDDEVEHMERLRRYAWESGLVPPGVGINAKSIGISCLYALGLLFADQPPGVSGVIRGEMMKSGCLALIVEEVMVQGVPTLLAEAAAPERPLYSVYRGEEGSGLKERMELVRTGLSVLEFATFGNEITQVEVLEEDSAVPSLLALLALCQQNESGLVEDCAARHRVLEDIALVLRLLINLSNDSEQCGKRIVECQGMDIVCRNVVVGLTSPSGSSSSNVCSNSEGVVGEEDPPLSPSDAEHDDKEEGGTAASIKSLQLDILLLTVALLTNVVEVGPSNANELHAVEFNATCARSARCFPRCACSHRDPAVSVLIQAFCVLTNNKRRVGMWQSGRRGGPQNDSILETHLAILIGRLMDSSQQSRRRIASQMPEASARALGEMLESFALFSTFVKRRPDISEHLSPRAARRAWR
ncbi:hypothetical protein EV182_001046 [Spiromyces aspiralis]|uniref:Uncharacterized protein n=1 Tax=Spiromyces aspiralis TaxID=68401 RepID=A0ACC1HVZ3_9FUNG|nr:hypothetical protein EV182_001046 [Spiromyces aspiralis]